MAGGWRPVSVFTLHRAAKQCRTARCRVILQPANDAAAWAHTASIAPTISCCRRPHRRAGIPVAPSRQDRPGPDRLASAPQTATGRPRSARCACPGNQKILLLQPADDLGAGRRRANALGFLQAVPQNLIIDKPPGILHRLDQRAFVVARRRPGFLVLDYGSFSSAVSPLLSDGSNCASSPFSSAGCQSGNAARQPKSMGCRPERGTQSHARRASRWSAGSGSRASGRPDRPAR